MILATVRFGGECDAQNYSLPLVRQQCTRSCEPLHCNISKFKILSISRYPEGSPGPAGAVMTIEFELDGQRFTALNGGPIFKLNEAFSLFVNCETQQEVDELWEKLSAGGEPGQCGWLKDKFGLSQIIPSTLMRFLGDKDKEKAGRTMQAMLKMKKLDIKALQQAHDGK